MHFGTTQDNGAIFETNIVEVIEKRALQLGGSASGFFVHALEKKGVGIVPPFLRPHFGYLHRVYDPFIRHCSIVKEKVEKRERKYHNTGSNSRFILGVLFRLKFALNGFVRRFHVNIFTFHVNVYKGH